MTLYAKMTMPDRSASSSVDASSAASFVASQVAEAPDTPDVRDVEVFSAMMKQTGHSLQTIGRGAVDGAFAGTVDGKPQGSIAGDMPSMASLMANMASAMRKATDTDGFDSVAAHTVNTDVVVANTEVVTAVHTHVVVSTAEDTNIVAANAVETDADAEDLLPEELMPSAYTASLFASMNSTLQTSRTVFGPVVVETAHVSAPHFSVKEIDAMVNMLVERIAVSDTKAHMVTVEVSLADTALRGTTLRLTRSLEGLLAVNLMTNDDTIFQTLVGAQIDLKARLETLDTGMVRVDISQAKHEQDRDQNRRSSTYQAYLGDDEYVN